MSRSGGSGSSLPYRHKIIITHGKDIYLQSLSNSSKIKKHFYLPTQSKAILYNIIFLEPNLMSRMLTEVTFL